MTIGRVIRKALYRLRAAELRFFGAELGRDCEVERHVVARCGVRNHRRGRIRIGDACILRDGVILEGYGGEIEIGQGTFIGPYTVVYGQGRVLIGDHCLIGAHCRVVSANHVIPPLGTDMRYLTDDLLPVKIGRDVWLGAGVTILGGVSVGDGCVIGAGAVVTADLPAGAIALGVPAVVKRFREASDQSGTG